MEVGTHMSVSDMKPKRSDPVSQTAGHSGAVDATIDYYTKHAREYFNKTVDADLSDAHDRFLSLVRPGGRILDAGCGSGRDLRVFHERGFAAVGIDASGPL